MAHVVCVGLEAPVKGDRMIRSIASLWKTGRFVFHLRGLIIRRIQRDIFSVFCVQMKSCIKSLGKAVPSQENSFEMPGNNFRQRCGCLENNF